jgi:hypothetical protein
MYLLKLRTRSTENRYYQQTCRTYRLAATSTKLEPPGHLITTLMLHFASVNLLNIYRTLCQKQMLHFLVNTLVANGDMCFRMLNDK